MSTLGDLPADQQAVLELLLRRHRTYDEIAVPLHMDPSSVRERAQAAVAALGDDTGDQPTAELRSRIADWLLGQEDPRATEAVRSVLATSRPARAWARAVAARLEALADEELPELPPPAPAVAEREPPVFDLSAVLERVRALPGRMPPLPQRARRLLPEEPSARTGAALLAAGVIAVLVLVVALTAGGGGGSRDEAAAAAGATRLPAPGDEASLLSTRRESEASGVATVLRRGGLRAIGVMANGLPRSTSRAGYDVWLSRGGREGAVLAALLRTDAQGRIRTLVPLPGDVDPGRFREVLVSRQSAPGPGDPPPEAPGLVVLRGRLTAG
jgi:hypothetical protein